MHPTPIIILNWNGLSDTIECVESVLNQSNQDFEIFLIDNNSQNDEFGTLVTHFGDNSKIILIKNDSNLGFGKAHNLIFEKLIAEDYKTVALLNNDAIADKKWLAELKQCFIDFNADIVASKMINYHERSSLDSAGLFMLNTGEILPRGQGQTVYNFNEHDELISFGAGACFIKLELIKQLGGFDDYFDTGYEDAELGLRAFIAGKKIVYSPKALVYHKMGQSIKKVISYKRTRKIQQDINYTYLKNIPILLIFINLPFYIIRLVLLILIHLITFRFRYLIILFDSFFRTLFFDLKNIIRHRKDLKAKRTIKQIAKAQKFFIFHDLIRFYRYFIKRNHHKFEKT